MKQINSIISAQFKAVCRKTIFASTLLCSFSMMANAQTQDGREFSIDGFAAYEGVAGSILTGMWLVIREQKGL